MDLPDKQCALAFEATEGSYDDEEPFVVGTPWFRSECAAFDLERNGVIVGSNLG